MAGLPKIAFARLKANPDAPKSSGPTLGTEAFQGADHPDANLLAAFVEKTLTEKERTQVLNHLSQCADCREVAVFTLPAEVAVAEPVRVAARRRWSPWLVLRWGALTAVLGALTVVVVLHTGRWKGRPEISQETPSPVPAGNITSAPQPVSAPPLAQLPPEPAQAKAQREAPVSAGELAAIEKASGPPRDLTLNDHAARAKAKRQVTLMAAAPPPATFRTENVPVVNREREEGKEGNALTAEALPAPPPSPASAAVTTAASEEGTKAGARSQAGPTASRATTQSVAVAGGNTGAGPAEAVPAKVAPRVPARATRRLMPQAPVGEMQAFRKDIESGARPPAALWSVSSDGIVQRSTDAGKTWERIQFTHGIKFRAIAALGNEVWTGGTGGALFHSADGGAIWTRAGINFAGTTVTETIAGIQLLDPQHLTVTTASGSQWVSEDGGRHWQKQP